MVKKQNRKPVLVFVGNGAMSRNLGDYINAATCVVRSQRCGPNFGKRSGSKTDVLCVRPSNEPWGRETAEDRLIPQKAAKECILSMLIWRHENPQTKILLRHYPSLQNKPMLMLNEEPARQLLLGRIHKEGNDEVNPTLGMVFLKYMIDRQMYKQFDIQCAGFGWHYGPYKEHWATIEKQIHEEWASQGFLEFLV